MTATQEQQERERRDRLAEERLAEALQQEEDRILCAWAPWFERPVVLS